jgi:hypothetical protein
MPRTLSTSFWFCLQLGIGEDAREEAHHVALIDRALGLDRRVLDVRHGLEDVRVLDQVEQDVLDVLDAVRNRVVVDERQELPHHRPQVRRRAGREGPVDGVDEGLFLALERLDLVGRAGLLHAGVDGLVDDRAELGATGRARGRERGACAAARSTTALLAATREEHELREGEEPGG